mmetsp:Transcript_28270/g.34328  ORF Transcript_28270/g.34328 Transcript_28270/m.34328 type:complete len:90 (+) Transcript_28270:496-765(+)
MEHFITICSDVSQVSYQLIPGEAGMLTLQCFGSAPSQLKLGDENSCPCEWRSDLLLGQHFSSLRRKRSLREYAQVYLPMRNARMAVKSR